MTEIRQIPPIMTREDFNPLLKHSLEGSCSMIVRKNGTNYEAIYKSGPDQAGMLLSGATSTDALVTFQAVEAALAANSKVAVSKNLSTWRVIRPPFRGTSVRGIYLTNDTLFIGSYALTSNAYHYYNSAFVLIYPLDLTNLTGEKSPHFLWNNQSITGGDVSTPILTQGTSKQTFFFKSSVTGVLTIQVYDEQAKTYIDFETQTIGTADKLYEFSYTLPVTAMRVKFDTTGTVTCWCVMED